MTVLSTPPGSKLPREVQAVFTEGHVEFWNASLTTMYNALSYYVVASWAHGESAFNLNVTKGDTTETFAFKTKRGDAKMCAETISGYVHMILADKQYKESEQKMIAKEQKWEQVFRSPVKQTPDNAKMTQILSPLKNEPVMSRVRSNSVDELDDFFNGVGSHASEVA
eukprot:TRINITY_DN26973_c0_g1_i1.p1 TRINITY_DN26973_c0_g1~~TRINITY_DN26973_c0_g1_i1.p1  ORF type:complete len:167 (+),score=30.58 TRINITY_DN26973_c0_g1_i1:228-728(+)